MATIQKNEKTDSKKEVEPKFYEMDGALRAYSNRSLLLAGLMSLVALVAVVGFFLVRMQPPTVIRVNDEGEAQVVSPNGNHRHILPAVLASATNEGPDEYEKQAFIKQFLNHYLTYDPHTLGQNWADAMNLMTSNLRHAALSQLQKDDTVGIYGEPLNWSNNLRTYQANCFGMTGGGKTTLLHSITEQDIRSGAPIIFIDGKGDWELFEKLIPAMEAAGRIDQLRVINPIRPDISANYNPFWSADGNYEEHISFIFESFEMDKDFFEGHQRVYLENIARVLHYTGKRFNFHDILVAAYDQDMLEEQVKAVMERMRNDASISNQQRLTLQMSVRNLLESFGDRERVAKIQGLINNLMTFMADDLALITGSYDNLLSLEEVIERRLILYVSLNVNVNERAVTALGRMLLQNLQLMIGRRYAEAQKGAEQPFVSVIMDEFSPFAYENFAHILVTARGANVAFLFALQSAPQLLQVGRGFRNDVASAPNTTFMLRIKDEETAQDFLQASARIRQTRRSMRIRKTGVFQAKYREEEYGSQTEIKDTLAQEEHIKRMPTGQMELLMPDRVRGMLHKHVHIRRPVRHWFADVPENLYPKYVSYLDDSEGLNLRFPVQELEEKRGRRGRKRAKA